MRAASGRPSAPASTCFSGFDVFANQPFLAALEQFILTDIGSHILDVARFLFGEASQLYCQTRRVHRHIKGEDVATVLMTMQDGMLVTCNMAYAGNWVNRQFQLDAFGEALLLFAAAARHDHLDTDGWRAAEIAATAIYRRWTEPDAGIWEIDNRPWTHSRLTAAAGLRAISAAHPAARHGADWLTLADRITADTAANALHRTGHWQRSPDDPALDAALLLPGLRGAIAVDDPRTVDTLKAYLRDLTRDGYAYRFRHDDRPLHEAEGSFLLCGFLVALSLHQQEQPVEARGWYERTRAACGPPQLFSEEYDTHQHQMRGNLPQAFVHALMIETSARLAH